MFMHTESPAVETTIIVLVSSSHHNKYKKCLLCFTEISSLSISAILIWLDCYNKPIKFTYIISA